MIILFNKQSLLYVFLLIVLFYGQAQPQSLKKLGIDDMLAIRFPESMAISPDGSEIIYTLSESDSSGAVSRTLWKVNAGSRDSKPLLAIKRNASSPKWSPEGNRVAFLSNDQKNTPQIWISDNHGSNLFQLTESGTPITSFEWSPNGEQIAYISQVTPPRSLVRIEGTSPHTDLLFAISLESKKVSQISSAPGSGISISWSPASDKIVYSSQNAPGFYGGFESDLFIYDFSNGLSTKITTRPGMDKNPKWSPDGKYIAFLSNYGKSGGLLPNIGLSLLSVADNMINDIGQKLDKGGFFEGPNKVMWSNDSKSVFYTVSFGAGGKIVRADIQKQTVMVFSDGNRSYDDIYTADNKNVMSFRISDYQNVPDIYITSLERFEPVRITDLNPQIKQINLPSAEVIKWKSSDGTLIEGLLVKPANFDPNKKYPLLVSLHGGPASSVFNSFPTLNFYNPLRHELLAANDYVVLAPNFRGSGGYGYEFRAALKNDWGTLPYQDLMSGVDNLINAGYIDSDRLGVMGWSYGGYLAAYTITKTNRFKAAAVGAGVTDLFGHFGKLPEQLLEYFTGHPWDPSTKTIYEKSSPMTNVHKIKTPTLIIHGENDTAVSISQAEQLHAALKTLGVENQFARYSGQGHSFFDRAAQRESFERVLEWFNKNLSKNK